MSSSNKSNKSGTEVSELMEKFDDTVKELGAMGKQIGKLLRAKKRRVPKDPDAEPGESRSAWQDWTSSCTKRFAKDYEAHLADVEKKADVMTFASKCKEKTHIDEWKEHEAAWLKAHPKPEKVAKKGKKAKAALVDDKEEAALVAASSSDERGSKKSPKKAAKAIEEPPTSSDERGSTSSKKSKKKAPEPDALPAASAIPEGKEPKVKKGKKDEKSAAKAAAQAASLAAAKANPPVPAKYRGKDYLKNDLNQVWQVGEDGEVGAWHGILSEDGKTLTKSDGPA